jgi:hypothetical protein
LGPDDVSLDLHTTRPDATLLTPDAADSSTGNGTDVGTHPGLVWQRPVLATDRGGTDVGPGLVVDSPDLPTVHASTGGAGACPEVVCQGPVLEAPKGIGAGTGRDRSVIYTFARLKTVAGTGACTRTTCGLVSETSFLETAKGCGSGSGAGTWLVFEESGATLMASAPASKTVAGPGLGSVFEALCPSRTVAV